MEIGKKIRKIRELRNFSQEYVAIQLGISQVAYSKIETGLTRLDLKRLIKIAETLDIDTFTLINFDNRCIFSNNNSNNQGGGNIVNHYHAEKSEKRLLIERVEKVEHEIAKLNEKIDKLFGGGF